MNNFTFEEINLMCIYNSGDGTRQELIEALTEMRGYLGADETELWSLDCRKQQGKPAAI